ncbi:MAG TPA: DUF2306 domain-containing protein [Ktedonobacteraceae bacterium]
MLFIRKNTGWTFLALFIILMTIVTLLTAIGILRGGKQFPVALLFYVYYPVLVLHIVLATIAVPVGIVQFLPQIRARRPRVHRLLGRTYIWCVLVSGVAALFVACFTVGFNKQAAFLTLGILWLLSGWKAWRAIRRGQVEKHRLWIVRNYALTLVAVFARLVVPLLIVFQALQGTLLAGGFATLLEESLGTGVWLSIVLNLVFADWLVNRSQKIRKAIGSTAVAEERPRDEAALYAEAR